MSASYFLVCVAAVSVRTASCDFHARCAFSGYRAASAATYLKARVLLLFVALGRIVLLGGIELVHLCQNGLSYVEGVVGIEQGRSVHDELVFLVGVDLLDGAHDKICLLYTSPSPRDW